ncbi:MAG: glycosyl transferase [Candidatus Synechococcus spongiarum 15L]|uniref:Glycosyl transferase n=1 Tax=Candidatus Synechococcus spongiarum 15L TaxID=1608419 RepID=A0A0G8AXJ0_9SYNE|nr:MAG: glycosyl transferase [Candidatus Synechococcus spongiarum 15L]
MVSPQSDIVLVSNGPGELLTWVRPLARRLHRDLVSTPGFSSARLHLVLTPCPHAHGQEAGTAAALGVFDQIVPARFFWHLLLQPRRYRRWRSRGVVVFLGGDQLWAVLLAARLGYRHVCYAEWVARWPRWCDRIAAMGPTAYQRVPRRWRPRAQIVGDLMADVSPEHGSSPPVRRASATIALLPGSKPAKLCLGVPFMLATAEKLHQQRPDCRFLLPLAPTVRCRDLLRFAGPQNPLAATFGASAVRLEAPSRSRRHWSLCTAAGVRIAVVDRHPAHDQLRRCTMALTTVGANTAELGALAVPMLVLLPTQHLHVMHAWDGPLGLLSRAPLLGRVVNTVAVSLVSRRVPGLAWPNLQAGRMVVPERIGPITPTQIAQEVLVLLRHPARLETMAMALRELRGPGGATAALGAMVMEVVQLQQLHRRRGKPLPPVADC